MKSQKKKKILVYDDDTIYGAILKREAKRMHIDTVYCSNMDDFCLNALENEFDFALIDYHLDDFKGDNVARVIEDRPIVLMSGDHQVEAKKELWPKEIVGFVSKSESPSEVLTAALNLVAA